MSLLDYLETQTMLNEIAMERGQYCYDYLKQLESDNKRLRKALRKIAAQSEKWNYGDVDVCGIAHSALGKGEK